MISTGFRSMIAGSIVAVLGALTAGPLTARVQTLIPAECVYSYAKGSGFSALAWCVNENGNLRQFTSPSWAEHIAVSAVEEGYGICSMGTNGVSIDTGTDSIGPPGFLPTEVVSTSPLVLQRYTGDKRFRLQQKFTTNYPGRELLIDMTVTNTSAVQENHLILTRFANLGISGSWATNVFDRSIDAVWARDQYNGFAVILSALKGPIERSAVVETINYTHFCLGDGVATPVAGDYGARVAFSIYNLAPGKSSTVRVSYRRQ